MTEVENFSSSSSSSSSCTACRHLKIIFSCHREDERERERERKEQGREREGVFLFATTNAFNTVVKSSLFTLGKPENPSYQPNQASVPGAVCCCMF